ncbi:MAG: TlpA family protein disulfide reductase [Nocardioidaceae bacterium]
MTTGLWVLCLALVLATALGLAARWYDGRFRVGGRGGTPERVRAAAVSQGQSAGSGSRPAGGDGDRRLSASELGAAALGERATLLQFSSAFCQPCRATRGILAEVASTVPGVTHVDIDAESHLQLVRTLGIMRTPTTLVLDAEGRITARASGQPRKEQVLAALPV